MSHYAVGATPSQRVATDGRDATPTHINVDTSLPRDGAVHAVRCALADLETRLAAAWQALRNASSDAELAREVENLRAEVRNQRTSLSALAPAPARRGSEAFINAGATALGGVSAWNVALNAKVA